MRTWILLFAIAGCNDNGLNGNGNINTFADYEKAAVVDFCQFYVRCGIYSASQSTNCQSTFNSQLGGQAKVYDYDAALQAGRISFDGAAASACLSLIGGSSCDLSGILSLGTNSSCQNVIKGLVPNGSACQSAVECQNGYCDGSTTPGCAGTCKPFAATGAACGNGVMCGKNDICKTSVCVTRKPQGAACTDSSDCASNLFCSNMTCQPPSAEGGPCGSGFLLTDCQSGLYCDRSAANPVCKRRLDVGGACTSDNPCRDGLRCSSQGLCQTVADVGQSCSTSACANDAACDTTATCKLTGQLGADCTSSSCAQGFYCDPAKKCAQKVPYGGTCDPALFSQCQLGDCDATSKTCTLVCM